MLLWGFGGTRILKKLLRTFFGLLIWNRIEAKVLLVKEVCFFFEDTYILLQRSCSVEEALEEYPLVGVALNAHD